MDISVGNGHDDLGLNSDLVDYISLSANTLVNPTILPPVIGK